MCRLRMTVNAKVSDSRKSQGTETQGQECPQLSVLTPAGKVIEAPAALGGGGAELPGKRVPRPPALSSAGCCQEHLWAERHLYAFPGVT